MESESELNRIASQSCEVKFNQVMKFMSILSPSPHDPDASSLVVFRCTNFISHSLTGVIVTI